MCFEYRLDHTKQKQHKTKVYGSIWQQIEAPVGGQTATVGSRIGGQWFGKCNNRNSSWCGTRMRYHVPLLWKYVNEHIIKFRCVIARCNATSDKALVFRNRWWGDPDGVVAGQITHQKSCQWKQTAVVCIRESIFLNEFYILIKQYRKKYIQQRLH